MGYIVSAFTNVLFNAKFDTANSYIDHDQWASSFFSFVSISVVFGIVAGILCWIEPAAAGSGIPEIKAYLNGINLNKVVRIRVLYAKVIGMCFSVAAGLPLGKEGPMIHSGAIVGAAVSQGKTITFGFDTSWTKFQDLRNDRSKRDFVTFGAAAGVAAAFSAPIGGILFTLEEGASFWSTTLTFRAFFCALITELTLSLLYSGFELGVTNVNALFAFGLFDDFNGYSTYELFIFAAMGCAGGILGAWFNHINKLATIYRSSYSHQTWKRMIELIILTLVMAFISFVFPLMWDACTPVPTNTADWTTQELDLLDELVQFNCNDNYYNQVASLYFTPADTAMQQLYHYREVDGTTYTTFQTGALLMFFIPYYLMAAITSGSLCPAGLFVPTLLAGATFGRIVGHILNCVAPGYVTDAGSYALVGAAALLGGMSRMTIAGTIILLEACGNSAYLLPLMVTFAAARYTGNAINEPMYDMHIALKELPFLEGSLKTLGLLNYHPIVELMAQPVITLNEINKVGIVYKILSTKSHNGFPVVDKNGHLRGFILRKTLCSIIKLKAFSTPIARKEDDQSHVTIQLSQAATVFHDTMERTYPHYPKIEDINLSPQDMVSTVVPFLSFFSLFFVLLGILFTLGMFFGYSSLHGYFSIHYSYQCFGSEMLSVRFYLFLSFLCVFIRFVT
jgi:chloride channel 7